jgi:hypothetical protein
MIAILSALTWQLLGVLLAVVGALITAALYNRETGRILGGLQRRSFAKSDATAALWPRDRVRLIAFARGRPGNVVVYDRKFSPFRGAGRPFGYWTETVDLYKSKDDSPTRDFAINELYDSVRQAVLDKRVPGVVVMDRLYVNGVKIRDDARFLPDIVGPPIEWAGEELMASMRDRDSEQARYCQCIHVPVSDGELILSLFLHFSKVGPDLHADGSYSFLGPVKEPYRQVDTLRPLVGLRLLRHWRALPKNSIITSRDLLAAGLSLFNAWLQRSIEFHQLTRELVDDPTFDYGADSGFRERAADSRVQQYFQLLDRQRYLKVVERAVRDSIVQFLNDHNIDSSHLAESKSMMTINNHGIMMSNDARIVADSVVSGQGNLVQSDSGGSGSAEEER